MKLVKFIVLFSVIAGTLFSCTRDAEHVMKNENPDRRTYLVAGFDDAAENTDVLFLLCYDGGERRSSIIQIPRDTYCNFGKSQNKINQIYASMRAEGNNEKAALSHLTSEISSIFGVKIDGYLGVTTAAFRETVDAFGGIEIELDKDYTYVDENGENQIHLSRGKNRLSGKEAEIFVRYRKGYVMGDLGRIDAQKLFLNAFFATVSQNIGVDEVIKVIGIVWREVVTDISLGEIIDFGIRNAAKLKESKTRYLTLPGEAVQSKSGLWYYVVNKRSAEEVMRIYLYSESPFDVDMRLVEKGNSAFENIYRDNGIKYKEYNSDNLSEMNILGN